MATVTKPIALDESLNTTELSSRNVADVLAQELQAVAGAIGGITHPDAEDIVYDNTSSGLTATNVQDAIDEVKGDIPTALSELSDDSTHRLVTDAEKAEWNATTPTDTTDDEAYVLRQGKGNQVDFSLEGASVAWNQLVQNGNFASTSGWSANGAGTTLNVSGNEATINASAVNGGIYATTTILNNHVYLSMADIKNTAEGSFGIVQAGIGRVDVPISSSYRRISKIGKANTDTTGAVAIYNKNAVANVINAKNVNLIDLTQLFGTTIADAIYAMEQTTAGSGVAFFRKYFPKAYYAYDTGSIQSVCVSERKVVGKNLFEIPDSLMSQTSQGVTFTINPDKTISTSGTSNADWTGFDLGRITLPSGEYIVSGSVGGSQPSYRIAVIPDGEADIVQYSEEVHFSMTSEKSCLVRIAVRYANVNMNGKVFYPMIRLATVTDATYEPYTSSTYPLPTTQLRGLFTLANGKLKANGDVLSADGSGTRKYQIITFDGSSDEGWNVDLSNHRFYTSTNLSDIKLTTNDDGIFNAISNIYLSKSYNHGYLHNTEEKCITGRSSNTQINVFDYSYTSLDAFKTALASKPLVVVYEKATPTAITTSPFQNPQRAYPDGTEEFIDGLTRDVIVPVGNNSTYTTSDVLASADDYSDGMAKMLLPISAVGTDESGRTIASRAYTTGEFFYMDGKMYKVLASIASGATFTVGTNILETTLFAELTALA